MRAKQLDLALPLLYVVDEQSRTITVGPATIRVGLDGTIQLAGESRYPLTRIDRLFESYAEDLLGTKMGSQRRYEVLAQQKTMMRHLVAMLGPYAELYRRCSWITGVRNLDVRAWHRLLEFAQMIDAVRAQEPPMAQAFLVCHLLPYISSGQELPAIADCAPAMALDTWRQTLEVAGLTQEGWDWIKRLPPAKRMQAAAQLRKAETLTTYIEYANQCSLGA